jgi:uncharacterized protein YndB with AHSA1/START domain
MPGTAHPVQLRISRHYPVGAEKIWRAWTDPQALSQWFGPSKTPSLTQAEIDLREGGGYRIGFDTPDGKPNEVAGEYQTVQPYSRLVFTWAWHSTPERISRVSIELIPVAGGTDMIFVHDRFFDDQARINHERGWNVFLGNLDDFMGGLT